MNYLEPAFVDLEPDTNQPHRPPRQAEFVWVDQLLLPYQQANTHLLSPAIHYGPGIVSSMRSYGTGAGPAIFGLNQHVEHFLADVRALGMGEPHFDRAFLRDVVWRVVLANDFYECLIRCGLYLESPLGLRMRAFRPILVVAAWELPSDLQRHRTAAGMRLSVSPFRQPRSATASGLAALSDRAADRRMAQAVARRSGFDEALLLDEDDLLVGGTDPSLLIVRQGVIQLPHLAEERRAVPEQAIISLARSAGYQVQEQRLPLEAIFEADEVLMCGTQSEVCPVLKVDGQPVGPDGLGPITAHLQRLYRQTAHGARPESGHWLDYLDRFLPPLY
ncbi:MAG: aminotransferase class IV [Candidatus Promineifilaceae bacterium]|nr:aminotransferase class IV [Candidatus Promineifilaceae bacterium]